MNTVYKFWMAAFDNRIEDKYEKKVLINVFASNEVEAIEKAGKLIARKQYEVYEVSELLDDRK